VFSIFKLKKRTLFPFDRLVTDLHSHLIPGIDDGSPDMDTSLQLIRGMTELGYQKIITTPHIMWDICKNTPQTIGEGLKAVQMAFHELGIHARISAAAEYFIDDHFNEMLQRDEPLLTLDSTKKVLVEISFVNAPIGLKEQLFEILMKGYQPVLAHPERYLFYHREKKQYEALKNAGLLFQANLLSFSGYYGKAVQDAAEYLVQKDYVNYLGTDLHNARHLENLRNLTLTPSLNKALESSFLLNREL
jgi:protein-tyrosine phosphatase